MGEGRFTGRKAKPAFYLLTLCAEIAWRNRVAAYCAAWFQAFSPVAQSSWSSPAQFGGTTPTGVARTDEAQPKPGWPSRASGGYGVDRTAKLDMMPSVSGGLPTNHRRDSPEYQSNLSNGGHMSELAEQVFKSVQTLPNDKIREVLDFVEFIKQRAERETQERRDRAEALRAMFDRLVT